MLDGALGVLVVLSCWFGGIHWRAKRGGMRKPVESIVGKCLLTTRGLLTRRVQEGLSSHPVPQQQMSYDRRAAKRLITAESLRQTPSLSVRSPQHSDLHRALEGTCRAVAAPSRTGSPVSPCRTMSLIPPPRLSITGLPYLASIRGHPVLCSPSRDNRGSVEHRSREITLNGFALTSPSEHLPGAERLRFRLDLWLVGTAAYDRT